MKKSIFLIIASIILSVPLWGKSSEEVKVVSSFKEEGLRVSDLYLQAIKELSIGDRNNGYSILKEVARISDTHAPTLAKLSSLESDKPTAIAYIERAIKEDTTNIDYKYQLANLLIYSNQGLKAIDVCKDIVRLDHKSLKSHLYLTSVYDMTSQPFAALNTLDSAIVIFGDRIELLDAKQQVLTRGNLHKQAIENGLKLIKLNPSDVESYVAIAQAYNLDLQPQKAQEYFNLASEIDPTDIKLLSALYGHYRIHGDENKAFETLVKIASNPNFNEEIKLRFLNDAMLIGATTYRDKYFEVGNIINILRTQYPLSSSIKKLYSEHLIRGGNIKGAIEEYKKMVNKESPDKAIVKSVIELSAFHYKSIDSLRTDIDLALDFFKNDIEMNMFISSLYRHFELFKESISLSKSLLKVSESDTTKSEVLGYIGDSYSAMGKQKTCYKYYKKALKYYPDNVVVLNNYSYFLSQEGKELELALKMAQKVMEKEPSNATYIDTYGWALYKLGEYEQAKNILRKAIALDSSGNGEILLHLGDVYFALGDKLSAQSYWNRAQNAGVDKKEIEERKNW